MFWAAQSQAVGYAFSYTPSTRAVKLQDFEIDVDKILQVFIKKKEYVNLNVMCAGRTSKLNFSELSTTEWCAICVAHVVNVLVWSQCWIVVNIVVGLIEKSLESCLVHLNLRSPQRRKIGKHLTPD